MGDFSNLINPTMLFALIVGLVVALILGPIFIPLLHKFKFGQNIREDGPQSHLKKAGTPTMGGIIFIIAIIVVMISMRYSISSEGMIILYSMIAFGFIGLLDDMLKIIHKNNLGLRAWQKMILLLLFSVAMAYYAYANIGSTISVPFTDIHLSLGIIYIPLVIIYYAATTNAVNLTDGLDGLATSVTIIVLIFFTIVSVKEGKEDIAVFCIGLIGALLGFLKYNRFKAKIFMGDTGSLALGGAIGSIALLLKMPIIVVIVGGIYVFEAASVIIQVISFKTRGKRVFKMAPVHHHFEQLGWSEVKVVRVFSLITIALCIIGYVSL
ncbi:phospho-N-acetylmuramoyl-pentapeptide-transferase [Clostridium thermobutyricum]|uniref:Phospho-N-acetylmuramoyl-pentapeptide-transferase n=1 Tax=Clostridium thermobutyricum DSM 4928 TaxID=1121339 RepID=A0A1V4SWL1_9CLOT|nr:phospho-N-acetylmuramoyl-pentapeptide-transferase [Clostridium thermobutyricum]OPX47956.1 phospho-N-acetylmuramoyl-pentapeptide-transferase [Clostridium thermobutyricum DSM 4928]